MNIEDVPSGLEAPSNATPSLARSEAISFHFSRRSMFKSLFVAAVAMSLTALDVVAKTNRAHAATNWGDCPRWRGEPTTATDWINCNPDGSSSGRIDGQYCNSNGYHRVDSVSQGGSRRLDHRQRDTSCAGKNAWEWFRNGEDPDPPNKRCSDGQIRYVTGSGPGSWMNSTCKELL